MGTAIDQLDRIAGLYKEGHLRFGARVADIGCQQLYGGSAEGVRRFLEAFGRNDVSSSMIDELSKNAAFIGHSLIAAGFDYTSFDIVEAPF
jgi:hypothetical protein